MSLFPTIGKPSVEVTGWAYLETSTSGGYPYVRWWVDVYGDGGQCNVASYTANDTTQGSWVYLSTAVQVPTWCEGPYTTTIYAQVSGNGLTTSARFDDATLNGQTLFFAEDSLGTARVVTNTSGAVCYDGDFYPFGGERPYTNNCTTHYKFEGKERDVETGNDEFGARYYSNRFGRWLSSDWSNVPVPVPYATLANPQTLNLYGMVGDDPETSADLDGHCGGQNEPTPTCKNVTVTVKVTEPARIVQGEKQDQGPAISGVDSKVQYTIKVNGEPLKDTKVDESNTAKLEVNGKELKSPNIIEGHGQGTNNAGQLDDQVAIARPAQTMKEDAPLMTALSTNAVKDTNTQTLTFKIPGGATCTCTTTRTLTNIGDDGKGSSNYTLNPGQPSVKPAQQQ